MKDSELEERVRERIAALEADRDETVNGFNAIINELKGCLGEAPEEDDQGNDDEPAPAPEPRRAKTPSKNGDAKRGSKTQVRVRELLLTEGTLRTGEIQQKLGVANQTVAAAVSKSDWFERVDPSNRLSPWQLTEAGRAG